MPSNPNHLQQELSPYLLQHLDNPVDWHPWGEPALQLAREQDRPILLSIGYSACHWCHVMAHESFEDPETAKIMNQLYVNIKVDREERPDLDKIYQTAHQLLTRRGGGWPLTVFLDPQNHLPFFAGTYFPPAPRHGLPSFRELLARVRDYFDQHRDELDKQNQALLEALTEINRTGAGDHILDATPVRTCVEQLQVQFDTVNGGFGGAPKFPQAPSLEFLAQAALMLPAQSVQLESMLQKSLDCMAAGGLQDHLGGGFYRYTVDGDWTIPHFEKMLYDNAQLLPLYAAAAARGSAAAAVAAEGITAWLARDMTGANGGFFSSLDADSDGEEGLYYVWQASQLRSDLSNSDWTLLSQVYGLDRPPNFEGQAWHLKQYRPVDQVAAGMDLDPEAAEQQLQSIRNRLLVMRAARNPPGLDDKQLSAWNGLMIRGLARAGRLLKRPEWIAAAQAAFDFVRLQMWQDGQLMATSRNGKIRHPAYLDDHAFLLQAAMELLQCNWSDQTLTEAIRLADILLTDFQDPDGGFFFTANQHETLIQRPKPLQDDATPNGNAVAALALLQLGHLLGDSRYLAATENTLKAAWRDINRAPIAHCGLAGTLATWLNPVSQILLIGDPEPCQGWVAALKGTGFELYQPGANTGHLPGILANYAADGPVTAYLCTGSSCLPPVTKLAELQALLADRNQSR